MQFVFFIILLWVVLYFIEWYFEQSDNVWINLKNNVSFIYVFNEVNVNKNFYYYY